MVNMDGIVSDFAFVQRHLNVILDKTSEKLKCTLRESLAKALQSWAEKGKVIAQV